MTQVASWRGYALVALALLALLGLTVGAAMVNLGAANTPVAMLISLVKAALIAWYFMHLRHAAGLVRLAAAAGFFWLAIMLAMTLSDFLSR